MFVDIENFKSPLVVENLLTPYKKGLVVNGVRQPKEPITPDICWKVLRSTNAPRNIKDMLVCISELPIPEQAQFKDVVLSTFDTREQPDVIVDLGYKLAKNSGYLWKFDDTKELNEGTFLLSRPYLAKGLASDKTSFSSSNFAFFEKLICLSCERVTFDKKNIFPKFIEFPYTSKVAFEDCDLIGVEKIYFSEGTSVYLKNVQHVPALFDVSQCASICIEQSDLENVSNLRFRDGASVSLKNISVLPPNLDFSYCDKVDLRKSDLAKLEHLVFKNGADVNLWGATNLPSQFDVSQCINVCLNDCDLIHQSRLNLENVSKIHLYKARNLPAHLDVSHCGYVDLGECDLSNQPHLSFKDGAKVNFYGARNLPPQLDFSCCMRVNLSDCDLSNQPQISFNEGANVILSYARNLPPHLDFSQCANVLLDKCNPDDAVCWVFKNREQLENSEMLLPSDKVLFADDFSACDRDSFDALIYRKMKRGR